MKSTAGLFLLSGSSSLVFFGLGLIVIRLYNYPVLFYDPQQYLLLLPILLGAGSTLQSYILLMLDKLEYAQDLEVIDRDASGVPCQNFLSMLRELHFLFGTLLTMACI